MSYLSLSYTAGKVLRNEVMAFNMPQLLNVFLFELKGGLDSQKCTDVSNPTIYFSARSKGTKTTFEFT